MKPSTSLLPRLVSIISNDSIAAWKNAGFHVTREGKVHLDNLTIDVQPTEAVSGVTSWTWEGLSQASLDGISVVDGAEQHKGCVHPNGCVAVDHIVVKTDSCNRTKHNLETVGIPMKRDREDIYPGIRQLFFRPADKIIVEVVGPSTTSLTNQQCDLKYWMWLGGKPAEEQKSSIWGITFVVPDLEKSKNVLGEGVTSKVRPAKQKGRQIMTVRHKELDLATTMAFMTPHPSRASL